MLGAIAGDIIGSVHEFGPPAVPGTPLFECESHFTDDTVLALATVRCLLDQVDYATAYREAYQANRNQSWGLRFIHWGKDPEMGPYNSFGNGSAMRVSPVGFWARSLDEALNQARRSAEVTHDHPEGIRGAQATVYFQVAMEISLSLHADTDTLACIVGGMAEARFLVYRVR